MPSYGGFYVSPTAWTEWLRAGDCPRDWWGSPAAEEMIDQNMREKGLRHLFGACTVPIPSTEPKWKGWGLMIYQRKSKQHPVYIPPKNGSDVDEAKRMLEEQLELKMTDWRSLWYDPHSIQQISYFLEPPESATTS
ncbi:hypothetical protein FS749_004563 [Ceratobasidium sp. UAMH 11750]|nr:hypothetical protein FS749_004563 [Ceratobasidium sp. UAMH 11750]